MAIVIAQPRKAKGVQPVNFVTLDGTDSFTYNPATDLTLIVKNDTGGALTPVLVGNATSYDPPGYQPPIDVSTGYSLGSIADGAEVILHLSSIREILGDAGSVSINTGTGLDAALLEG